MCFHIYAEQRELTVLFASENIELRPDGTSEILIDVIIKNESFDPVDTIGILYPKSFIKPTPGPTFEAYYSIIKDYSNTIIDPESPLNSKYICGGYKFIVKKSILDNSSHEVSLHIPNYTAPCEKPEIITSYVKDIHLYEIHKINCNVLGIPSIYSDNRAALAFMAILDDIKFTIFSYEFKTPLKKDESRFIRLKIGPYPSVMYGSMLPKEIIRSILDKTRYRYEIVSPYDVIHRFITKTYFYGNGLSSKPLIRYSQTALNVIKEIINDIRLSKTTYNMWKISIWPNSFRSISDFTFIGNIKILGSLPNENQDQNDHLIDLSSNTFIEKKILSWAKKRKSRFFPHTIRRYDFWTKNEDIAWIPENVEKLDEHYGFRMFFTCSKSPHTKTIAKILFYTFISTVIFIQMYFHPNITKSAVPILNNYPLEVALATTFVVAPLIMTLFVLMIWGIQAIKMLKPTRDKYSNCKPKI